MNSAKNTSPSFEPIKTRRAFEEVSSEIKKAIINGNFRPGDRLPPETVLARQFNVSRQTVREALRILELSGFVTIQRGAVGGAIIEDTILKSVSGSLFDAIQMRKISPEDLDVCRLEIEKAMMRYVISYADETDFERLQANIDEANQVASNGNPPFKQNLQFHRILASASKNHMFYLIVDSMMAVITDFFMRIPTDLEVSKEAIRVHEDILDSIKKRNVTKALLLLEKHIPQIGQRFRGIADSE